MSWSLVPGNRWDLLPPAPAPTVTVVVTHYQQQPQLDRTLAALRGQADDVVVADDGSAVSPVVPPGVRVVRQDDLGFRAAAARNLGASGAGSDVLVFLDADTTPEPGFVRALVRHAAASPDVLAVGRRRHADLSGDGRELPEPVWLRDGYAGTRDLLDADGRSFRYVISAVMACRRELFEDLGGFDERYVGYGGEDWDLAYRAWNAGALFVHEPAAVAWHDGPDWAGRPEQHEGKALETARLAALVPEPSTRGGAPAGELPDVLVDLDVDDAACRDALDRQQHRDLRVRGSAPWTPDQLARARVRLHLSEPVRLAPTAVGDLVARLTDGGLGELAVHAGGRRVGTAHSTRALGRARRWAGREDDVVGRCFGREDATVEVLDG